MKLFSKYLVITLFSFLLIANPVFSKTGGHHKSSYSHISHSSGYHKSSYSHSSHYSSRIYYGGGHHTTSHGGYYKGGQGSSHKGGHYKNPKTNNHYGRHK
jgi:hypothetical protein